MTTYIIAQLKFNDRETYNRYQAQFWEVFQKSNGQLLVADEHPILLEGEWDLNQNYALNPFGRLL